MANEPGLFSAHRKRETLGAISHNISAIPMPSSALKRTQSTTFQQAPHATNHVRSTSGSRMSLAPGRPSQPMFHRSPSGDNLAAMGFATVQRPSTQNLFPQTTGGRKSFAPVSSMPAHPISFQDGPARRSSVYAPRPSGFGPAAHHSFFATAPPTNGIPTDPRNLRSAGTRQMMGNELMEFLTQRNFEMEMKHTLTHKTMTSPTQKDFDLMFQFLYHCIDPSYRFQKGIAAEIPPLLKQMRYPFEMNISKSQLSAVGGNNWSTFLGLLHWMMQLAKMMEQYCLGMWDDACVTAGFDIHADRITFEFLTNAYKEWLSIEDDDDEEAEAKRRIQPHIDAMAARFEQANAANLEQLRELEAEARKLQEQIDELGESAPRLAKLEETIDLLEADRVLFETYNASMDAKVEKYTNKATVIREAIEKCEAELAEAEAERDELQRKVDDQGLSIQDIDRMNTERERLMKGVETTQVRLEEAKERTAKIETETAAKLDDLENAVRRYNGLGYQIGVIPPNAQNAHGLKYEISLQLNAGPDFTTSQLGSSRSQTLGSSDRLIMDRANGYQPVNLLPSVDMKLLKQQLQGLRKDIAERRNTAMEEDMGKVDMLDKTREALEDKHAELETLQHRVGVAQGECEKIREMSSAQSMASDAQIEKMEKELNKMRVGLGESVQLMEQREMNVNLEYEQMTTRAAQLREELHTELEKILNEVVQFKLHIQGSLERYEDFVAEEHANELQEQEAWNNRMFVGGGGGGSGTRQGPADDEMEE